MLDGKAIKAAFGRAAAGYDEQAQLQQEVRAEAMRIAAGYVADSAFMLDAGCGTGALAREARLAGIGWRVTGLDVAPEMCLEAGRKGEHAVCADASAMPFGNESFDGVFSSLLLQWADNPIHMLREMARVLKPRGSCMIATLTQGTLQELRDAFAAIDSAPHVSEFLGEHALSALMVHAGFILLDCKEDAITRQYPDAASLMRSIKAIGASNKDTKRKRGLMTPRQLARLEEAYREKNGDKNAVRATWNVAYFLLEKR